MEGHHFVDIPEACMQDLCYNFSHPYYFSSNQNKKAVDHRPTIFMRILDNDNKCLSIY